MDEFVNKLDHKKFESTNSAWNSLMLNDPWSVGFVTAIIAYKDFDRKEDWEDFYYKTGAYRNDLIEEKYKENVHILNDFERIRTDKKEVDGLSNELKQVNTEHGRTSEQLQEKAVVLHSFMKGKGSDLTINECFECVRFRTICQTWNGVVLREKNTIENLKRQFPLARFENKGGEFDHKYAVDYELYLEEDLKCGIQIKPKSYTLGFKPYIQKARTANKRKNSLYTNTFKANVLDVIAKTNGEVINKEVLTQIDSELTS